MEVVIAILVLTIIFFIVKLSCKLAVSDLFCREDSWRVSEMNCNCGKSWIATYPSCCISLECPSCREKIKMMVIK